MTVTFAELFAGIGGLGEGFRREGARCVFANEYDRFAAQTYAANNDVEVDTRDVREVSTEDIPDHEILLAGFPCQPFSVAGISKRRSLGMATGMECHDQGNLFFEAARIIKAKQPLIVVFENVKNFARHDGGRTYRIVMETMQAMDYWIDGRVLDASAWVPQHRERIFIVAVKGEEGRSLQEVQVPDASPMLDSILHRDDGHEDVEPPYTCGTDRAQVSEKYTLTDRLWSYLREYKRKHQAKGNGFGYSLVGPADRARTLSARYYKDGSEILVRRDRGNPRRLTPRECSRLMGFDEGRRSDFRIPVSDNQAYRQFGNAVVPPVAQAVAKVALACL